MEGKNKMANLNEILDNIHKEWFGNAEETKVLFAESKALADRQNEISKRMKELNARQGVLSGEIQKKLTETKP